MEDLWNAPFFQRRNWILENLELLHLDTEEALVVLLIDYWTETNQSIDYSKLAKKCKLTEDEIEAIVDSLYQKEYLKIQMQGGSICFDLKGLFELKGNEPEKKLSLIERFEFEFKRTLSPNDIQRILDMASRYDERRLIVALNEAVVYEKVNLNYIETMLVRWMDKGLSIEDVENGKR